MAFFLDGTLKNPENASCKHAHTNSHLSYLNTYLTYTSPFLMPIQGRYLTHSPSRTNSRRSWDGSNSPPGLTFQQFHVSPIPHLDDKHLWLSHAFVTRCLWARVHSSKAQEPKASSALWFVGSSALGQPEAGWVKCVSPSSYWVPNPHPLALLPHSPGSPIS